MGETSAEVEQPPARWANLRVLWSFVRPHRVVLSVGMLLALVVTGTSLASPLVTKGLLDSLDDGQLSVTAVVVLAVLMVVSSGLSYVQIVLLGRTGEKIVLGARTAMVRRLFRVRPVALARRSSGEFVTRVTSDSVLLREATSFALVEFVNGLVGVVGALVLMAVLDWVLLTTTVVTLVVVAAVVMALMPALAAAQRDSQDAIGRLGAALEGAMRAVRTVKASCAEEREADRILVEAQTSTRHSIRAVRIQALAWTVTGGGLSVALMLVLGLGAYRVSEGALAVSSLVAFLLYAFQLMAPAMILAQVVTQLQSGIAAAARISDVLAMPVEEDEAVEPGLARLDPAGLDQAGLDEPGSPVNTGGAVLSFRGVTARYSPGTPAALDDVSVDVARTGHTAIVGPSGAGKTTMFSLALRFLNSESGSVALDGVPVEQWPLASLRRRMVYVEQDAPLVPGTLAENLRYTNPAATDDELWDALRAVQLDERVRRLEDGLDTTMFGAAVSGGERQRVALARALVSKPEVLLLDEATAQLDALTEAAVQRSVRRLATTGAVVTIAHRLSTVVDADTIVLLEAGRCRAVGTHAELLRSDELYAKLVAALRIAAEPVEHPSAELSLTP